MLGLRAHSLEEIGVREMQVFLLLVILRGAHLQGKQLRLLLNQHLRVH